MSALLVIIALVVGYLVLKGRKVTIEPPAGEEAFGQPQDIFPSSAALGALPKYSLGTTFHHKETGEKVEVISSPDIVDGEYAIRWPSGGIGYIHQSSFEEFFV